MMRRGSSPRPSSRSARTPSYNRSQLQFELLETRRVLAASIYLDFGDGFPTGLTISDSESQALGGPAVFGDSYSLSTLNQDLAASGFTAAEIAQFKSDVVMHLDYLFAPFDVSIQTVAATSLADMGATLGSTVTNDAYVYFGGTLPSSVERDMGAAVIDSGNTQDNLAFVFSASDDTQSRSDPARFFAAQVAKQAAHTFGALSTEYLLESEPPLDFSGVGSVMQMRGTDVNGDPIFSSSPLSVNSLLNWGFTRNSLAQTHVDGVSPGQHNVFEYLTNTVGRNTEGIEYATTIGREDDVLTVHLKNNDLVELTSNGETFDDLDASVGLVIYPVGFGGSEVSFVGQSVHAVMNSNSIVVNEKITLTMVNEDVPHFGKLRTGSFNDTIDMVENRLFGNVDTGDGNDTINVETVSGKVNAGNGNDRFNIKELANQTEFDGGPGYDILDFSAREANQRLGLWDTATDGFTFYLSSFHPNLPFFEQEFLGIDEVLGSETHGLELVRGRATSPFGGSSSPLAAQRISSIIANGDLTMTVDNDASIAISNVSHVWGGLVNLQSTERPIILDGHILQVSSSLDRFTSNMDGIMHDVVLKPNFIFEDGQRINGQVVISNAAGSGKEISLTREIGETVSVKGIATGKLIFEPQQDSSYSIYGSDSDADTFLVTTSTEEFFQTFPSGGRYYTVFLLGLGGNDYFEIGSGLSEHAGDLGLIGNGEIEILGGQGDDYVYLNDEQATGAIAYQIDENGISELTHPGESAYRLFNDFKYNNVETVRLTANSLSNRFKVSPSIEAVIMIEAGEPGAGDGDSLGLYGPNISNRSHIVEQGQGNGTWYFGNGINDPKLILFRGVETVTQSDRLAVGSQYGSDPLVSVFESSTGRFLFDIQPYEADYIGGVQVETADLNGDTIPDIVVAPGWGRFTEIKIYDGRDGSFLASFFAYPSNLPNPQDNFTAGADLAIANVLGDERFEIVTSTLWGTADIRVFSQTAPLQYDLTLAYNPFDDVVRGVRIDTGNFSYDGRHEIIASVAPGNLPQVRIHTLDSQEGFVSPVIGFTDYAPNYLGGFNLTVGDFNGDLVSDIAIAGVDTGSSIDPFSGIVRVLDGKSFPPNFEVRPIRFEPFQAFPVDPTRGVSLKAMDFDVDGVIDRVFTSQEKADNGVAGEIKIFDGGLTNQYIDSIFADSSVFNDGLSLG